MENLKLKKGKIQMDKTKIIYFIIGILILQIIYRSAQQVEVEHLAPIQYQEIYQDI